LSTTSSANAATVKTHGVTAAPKNSSGVPWRFSHPRRAAQLVTAGAVIERNPAVTPIRKASK